MTIYFAWSVNGEEFDSVAHAVNDEDVVAFRLEQNEGDFCTLSLEVENPRVGPLAPGRPIWAWLSWQENPIAEVVPLFFGRLIGVPSNILGNIITYEFRARPSDYADQKADLADTLAVPPYYDEIFIDENHRDDPDAVLEAYSAAWHIDRITHEVSISDFLVGEDGAVEFLGTGDVIDGSLQISLDQVPVTTVIVKGEVPWSQSFSGTISLPLKSWKSTADVDGWPKVGDSLAGGYYVIASTTSQPLAEAQSYTITYSWTNQQKKHRDGDLMSHNESLTALSRGGDAHFSYYDFETRVVGDKHTGTPGSYHREVKGCTIAGGLFSGSLVLGVDAKGDRKDLVTVVVSSDLQPVLKDPEDTSDSETIELSSALVDEACGDDESVIGNNARGEYITTDRGLQSVQYMIARARARLIIGARVVRLSWECPFNRAVDLSCRLNARIFDAHIPGGEAIGKIVGYGLRGDGRTGEFRGFVTIACAIGFGNAISTSPGTADYVDESYVDDYQTFTGQVVALASEDIGYSPPTLVSGGGGLGATPLGRNDVVIRDEIIQEGDTDIADAFVGRLVAPFGNSGDVQQVIDEIITQAANRMASIQSWREIELADLTQQGIESHWEVATTLLVIPRQIDLTVSPTV